MDATLRSFDPREVTRRQALALLGGAAAGLAVVPGSMAQPAAGPPRRGGTLTYAHTQDVFVFDPGQLHLGNWPMFHSVYDSVVRLDEVLKPQPWLAESWEFGDGGRQLKLTLRKGVRFHSGREFTAEDVAFSVKHYQTAALAANIRPQALLIKGVKVDGPSTAILQFDNPNPVIFDTLDLLFIIDKDSYADIKRKGVGTGPFKFADWSPGDKVRLVRNPNYWKPGLPYLDELVIQVFPDQQGMVAALEAGRIDFVDTPTPQDFLRVEKNKSFQALKMRSALVANPNINVENPKFANKYVRQAINHAIDRKRYVEIATLGLSEPICLPSPRTSWAYYPELEGRCKFDLELAKKLMAQGGAAAGFEAEAIVSTSSFPEGVVLAQIMRDDLAKIGIRLKIRDLESTEYTNIGDQARFPDIYIQLFGRSKKDPGSLFGTTVAFRPKTNIARFKSDEYANLVVDAASTVDQAKRKTLYRKLNEMLLEEAFSLAVAPRIDLFLLSGRVRNLRFSVDNMPYLGEVWLTQ
ncbi:MAG: ABC transporter substrate-binding protein [Candidatus Rokuibacteriota bacterium]